jgi:hypothetical protein
VCGIFPYGKQELLKNKLYKFGAGFFSSRKAEEAQIAALSKLTTTQHDGKKTSEMYELFFNSDLGGRTIDLFGGGRNKYP